MADVISTLVAGLLAIAGIWIGHRWASNEAVKREERVEERQSKSIRLLLKLEIDQNVVTLNRHWELFQGTRRQPLNLAMMPKSVWRTYVWDTQIGMMTIAFDELMIARISNVYRSLQELTVIQEQLTVMYERDRYAEANAPEMFPGTGMRQPVGLSLDTKGATKLLSRWISIADDILKSSNPLRADELTPVVAPEKRAVPVVMPTQPGEEE